MLGIRKYNGVAIDLFQGDITTFFCDGTLLAAELAELPGIESHAREHRHVAVSVDVESEPVSVETAAAHFRTVKVFLDRRQEKVLRRITFVLTSSESYQVYQQALFGSFPEQDSEV